MEFKPSSFEFSSDNYGVLLNIDDLNDDILRNKSVDENNSEAMNNLVASFQVEIIPPTRSIENNM